MRKPFNYEKIEEIKSLINQYKIWGDKYNNTIKSLEEKLLIEIKKSLKLEQNYNVTALYKIVSLSIDKFLEVAVSLLVILAGIPVYYWYTGGNVVQQKKL